MVARVFANTIGAVEFPKLVNLVGEYDPDHQLLHNEHQLPNVNFLCQLCTLYLQMSMQLKDSYRPCWVAEPSGK